MSIRRNGVRWFAGMAMVALTAGQCWAQAPERPVAIAKVHGAVTETVEGREVPVPTGVSLHFANLRTKQTYEFKTVGVSSTGPVFDEKEPGPVADRRPSNYWGKLPAGLYKVKIRDPRFLPYNDPRQHEIRHQDGAVRLDFAGLRRRMGGGHVEAQAATEGDSSSAEAPLAGTSTAPAQGSSDGLTQDYYASNPTWVVPPPRTVAPGQHFRVTVSFRNTGTKPWYINRPPGPDVVWPIQIGSPRWAVYIVPVPQQTIFPRFTGTWTIDVVAKDPGNNLPLRFKLCHGGNPFPEPTTTLFVNVK